MSHVHTSSINIVLVTEMLRETKRPCSNDVRQTVMQRNHATNKIFISELDSYVTTMKGA